MPIQYTGATINNEADGAQKLAFDFAELTRQAKTEQSHEYAKGLAASVGAFLFSLASATNEEVQDHRVAGRFRANIDACKQLGIESHSGMRSHNWVRNIAFLAIALFQRLDRD